MAHLNSVTANAGKGTRIQIAAPVFCEYTSVVNGHFHCIGRGISMCTIFTHTKIFVYALLLLLLDCVCYWWYFVGLRPYAMSAHNQTHCQHMHSWRNAVRMCRYTVFRCTKIKIAFFFHFAPLPSRTYCSFFFHSLSPLHRILFGCLSVAFTIWLHDFGLLWLPLPPTYWRVDVLCLHVFHGNLNMFQTKDSTDISFNVILVTFTFVRYSGKMNITFLQNATAKASSTFNRILHFST